MSVAQYILHIGVKENTMLEKLEQELQNIRKQKEQAMANYNAVCGAEQMLLHLIEELGKGDEQNDNNG